ncbi:MAG TPA: hypothetical protein VJ180_11595 [Pyrinomonadaceae bacterium]|nr:hypothetical protein [Pyrinomonadaceae bacterium]
MKLYAIAGVSLMIAFLPLQQEPAPQIVTLTKNGITTVRLTPLKISGQRDHYYSLHLMLSFTQEKEKRAAPEFFDLELQTVVPAAPA